MENLENKNPASAENELVLKLSKPYPFEGETCTEIDLSGLETVTAGMLERVSKTILQQSPSLNPAMLESTMPFCIELVVRVTKRPYEFFRGLPVQDAMKLKALVANFLYSGDGEE
ncbi:MAG: phage tail assembly protein [Dysosmobacter sp.]|nr:phage tail assembly protein [Dysosmobacter sp.]